MLCPVSKTHVPYAEKVLADLAARGFYVDVDAQASRSIAKQVKMAQLAQYNYILVIGEKVCLLFFLCVIFLLPLLYHLDDSCKPI